VVKPLGMRPSGGLEGVDACYLEPRERGWSIVAVEGLVFMLGRIRWDYSLWLSIRDAEIAQAHPLLMSSV
jgi:hypothetical protein